MPSQSDVSEFRVEKFRSHATLRLTTGEEVVGCFFLSLTSAHVPGPERVGELLNAEVGFFPFEVTGRGEPRTSLFNRSQVVFVTLVGDEARQVPGYDVATRYRVAIRLAGGSHLEGTVSVYSPHGRDRLSDWARDPEQFLYVECDQVTALVNMRHVVDVTEVPEA